MNLMKGLTDQLDVSFNMVNNNALSIYITFLIPAEINVHLKNEFEMA
jgi:hypothetical protein